MDWTRLVVRVDVYRPGCNEIGVRFETSDGKKRFVKSFKHGWKARGYRAGLQLPTYEWPLAGKGSSVNVPIMRPVREKREGRENLCHRVITLASRRL